jgi:hypothetical protein
MRKGGGGHSYEHDSCYVCFQQQNSSQKISTGTTHAYIYDVPDLLSLGRDLWSTVINGDNNVASLLPQLLLQHVTCLEVVSVFISAPQTS